ncbi:restriction endonuclease [Lentibacillus lipolyticus]|nr:restriction endonuclease [Lentibacillus lipolyticus]
MEHQQLYDYTSPTAIASYSRKLQNKTFRDVLPEKYKYYKGKGGLGQLLEKYFYMYEPNSDKNPDFEEAGVELKVVPFKRNRNGDLRAKERIVLSIINYMEVVHETFETSSFLHKNRKLMLIFYEHMKDIDKLDYNIMFTLLFQLPEKDLEIIKEDWIKIVSKIRDGKAEELSEGDTFYLGACTKGATRESSYRQQPYSTEKAPQRAFSLKSKYVTSILNDYAVKQISTSESMVAETATQVVPSHDTVASNIDYQFNRTTDYDPIVHNVGTIQKTTFEDYVLDTINWYKNRSVHELAQIFDVNDNKLKNFASKVSLKMLGVETKKAEEFEKANVKVKAIRIEENGTIREHMSFPAFQFTDLVKESWETSSLRELLFETKFLFIIFRYENGILNLKKGMFWSMPVNDLDENVKEVWEKTRKIVSDGIQVWTKGQRRFNNLPSAKDNPVAHVRPHASDKNDTYPLPGGGEFTKQSFWLNKEYILNQIKE